MSEREVEESPKRQRQGQAHLPWTGSSPKNSSSHLPGSEPEDAFAALKAVAEVGTVLGALCFAGGWSYMASYYMMFGLSPLELGFSIPATSAFSLHMLRNSVWPLPAAALLLAGLLFGSKRLGQNRRAWAGICLAALLLIFATAGTVRGRARARQDMFDTSPTLPNVGFVSKSKGLEPDCLGEGTTDCKLLLHTNSTYYFFKPLSVTDPSAVRNRSLNVYMTHDSEIIEVHLERGLE